LSGCHWMGNLTRPSSGDDEGVLAKYCVKSRGSDVSVVQ
jgi:hypothetical protein